MKTYFSAVLGSSFGVRKKAKGFSSETALHNAAVKSDLCEEEEKSASSN